MSSLFVHVVERDMLAYRRQWMIFLTGFVEPLLYLLSIGVGVGALVGSVHVGGQTVDYDTFVAPGLLAVAAMNGSVFDTTFNFFFKFKYARSFDAMLATPLRATDVALGELSWALLRGSIYAAAFLVTMALLGLVESPWGILCLPAAMLIGFASAGAGMAATTFYAVLRGLRLRQPRADPAVPVLGDVLPALPVPDGSPVGHPGHTPLPGRRPRALARVRRPELDSSSMPPIS